MECWRATDIFLEQVGRWSYHQWTLGSRAVKGNSALYILRLRCVLDVPVEMLNRVSVMWP